MPVTANAWHCYDTRFRPYLRDGLKAVVGEGVDNYRRIVANLPDSMIYRDPAKPDAAGNPSERIGRIIMAGGELLIDPVREALFYPALDAVREKYGTRGARVSMQTTGDVVTPQILDELRERGVWMIAVASMDDYHVGMEGEKRLPFMENLKAMFEAAGFNPVPDASSGRDHLTEDGPFYVFFGAQPGQWIAELWPRGRAWERLVESDDGNQFLRALVGREEFSQSWLRRCGSRHRTERRRLSLLPENQTADRKPDRGTPRRHSRQPERSSGLRGVERRRPAAHGQDDGVERR